MAQNQSLQHKRSTTPGAQPNATQVAIGELAINFADKSIYTQDTSGNIIELARDLTKSATAPGSPSIGYLWYDTTDDILNIWDGAKWVNTANTGKSVLPGSTSAVPTFASGSGTSASPYVYSISTAAGTTVLTNVVTITGLAPNQVVPIVDLNSASNGGRFRVTNNISNASGVLKFNIIFTDLPASTAGTNYTSNFKIGNGTVYVNITGAIASSFPQAVDFPTGVGATSTLWTSANNTLTSTGDLLISLDGVTFGAGPLAITTSATLYTKWSGDPGTGLGIDGADGATITGSVLDSSAGPTSASLVINKTPDPIVFTSQTGVAQSTAIDSNTVTVSGINSYAYITSSDTVLVAVAGGSFSAVPSSGTSRYVVSGQTLALRQTSSSGSNTATTVTVAVGGSSAAFTVTTITSGIVTPSITTPTNGSTGISVSATLTSSAYAVVGAVGTHLNSDWEISSDSGFSAIVASSLASTTNLTTWTPTGLGYSTQYWAQVRYRSNDSTPVVSSYSPVTTWTTGIEPGTTWTTRTSGTTEGLVSVAWNGSLFVVVGGNGKILTSPDGTTWTTRTSGTTNDFNDVVWNGSLFVAVDLQGDIHNSSDGTTWTRAQSYSDAWESVTWGNSLFVVVGAASAMRTSLNGTTWTVRTSGAGTALNAATWGNPSGNSLFVAVGNSSTVVTSPDGTTWTKSSIGSSTRWYGVNWGNSLFVAVGELGQIYTSPNGTTWTTRTTGTTSTLRDVASSNSLFVAVGNAAKILTSQDGITWTLRTSGTTNSLEGVAWNGSLFVAVGGNGTILTSP